MNQFLLSIDAARLLRLSPAGVRDLARKGVLPVAEVTEGGVRLFRRADVERLREARRRKTSAHEPRETT